MSDSQGNSIERYPPGLHEERVFSLVDIAAVLWRRKWLIIGATFFAGVAAVGFFIISLVLPPERSPLPNYYQPEAMLLVTGGADSPGFGQSSGGAFSDLAALAGVGVSTGTSYGDLAVELATSRSILDRIVDDLEVIQHYNITEFPQTKARKELQNNITVNYAGSTNLLRVSYEDVDPEFATNVVNNLVTLLNERFRTIGGNRAITRRDLLQEKIAEVEARIAEIEAEIAEFTRQYGVVDIETATEEQAQTMANLRSELILTEMEIETYSEFARINDPVLQRLRSEQQNLRTLLREMEEGSPKFQGVITSQQDIPALAFRYEGLRRNLTVQSTIYENLRSELELARLNAEGQEPILQILELAEVPEMKAGPSRSILTVAITTVAFVLSILAAFVVEYVASIRSDPRQRQRFKGET